MDLGSIPQPAQPAKKSEEAPPASGQPEFGIPSKPQELLPLDEPAPPAPKAAPPAGGDQSRKRPWSPLRLLSQWNLLNPFHQRR